MTEKSYFWDGTVTGDSSLAPYNAEEFNTWILSSFLSINGDEAYVIPGYLDDLEVISSGLSSHGIIIKSGAACFDNYVYISDESINIPITRASTGNKRRDMVVLRVNLTDEEVRVAVVAGSEATPDTYPALTRTANIYEVALAALTVDSTFTYVAPYYVHDRRKFIFNVFGQSEYTGFTPNLLRNSEWLSFSGDPVANVPFEEWTYDDISLVAVERTATTQGSGRGDYAHAFSYITNVEQWIQTSGHTFTLKAVLNYTTIDIAQTVIGLRAYRKTGDESSVNKAVYVYGPTADESEILFTVTFPEDDIEKLYVYITDQNSDVLISQIIVVPGYYPGGYRPIPETLMFKRAVADAAWTATAKSTGTTTIDLVTGFNTVIKNYTKAVILRLRARDSASAAAASCYLRARGYAAPFNAVYGTIELGGVPNDVWRETTAIVPVDQIYWGTGAAGAQFRLDVVATGAGTLDATVEVVGIII